MLMLAQKRWPLVDGRHRLLVVITIHPHVLSDIGKATRLSLLNRFAKRLVVHLFVLNVLRPML